VRRSALTLALAAVVAGLVGCGGSGNPDERTLHASRLPFTFRYPAAFHASAPQRGPILALVALDVRDALAVRRTSERELDPAQYLAGLRAGFARQGLHATQRRERHAGRDMGVLSVDLPATNPAAGGRTALQTTSYFFAGGGGTWQLECRTAARRAEVGRACRMALSTLRFE
jgi:hypothetical protein